MNKEVEKKVKSNSKIKDTVFSSLFYECENAVENAKELYKAITGKTVKNAEKCRLEDAIFRERIQNRPELLQCETLYGYSYLIDKTRKYKGDTVQAVRDCEKNNILKEYLEHYGSEVINMLNIEYNADEAREYLVREVSEESFAKGETKGKAEGILSTLVGLVKDGILTLADAAKRADMTVAEFESKTGIKA